MPTLEDESIDIILTDPPYKYLKHKLETDWNEELFFNHAKRVLTKDGFIVMFGRGTSFYRWNTMLADLGFVFKEEIIWDKSQNSSPLMNVSRVHETVSIHTKGSGVINKVKVPYLEMKGHDIDGIVTDIKRLKSVLNNPESLNAVLDFLKNNYQEPKLKKVHKHVICQSKQVKDVDRNVSVIQSIQLGYNEKSIINKGGKLGISISSKINKIPDSVVDMNKIENGLNEKTIYKVLRDHYNSIHPTQKPVRLLERLLSLVLPKKPKNETVVLDPFGGSLSTMKAVYEIGGGLKGISCEIENEYFNSGAKSLREYISQTKLF